MTLPGGIRTKIALALLVVIGGALAAAYLVVVPSLEQRLVDAKLDTLQDGAVPIAVQVPATNRFIWYQVVEDASLVTNSRVVVFELYGRKPTVLSIQADSSESVSADVENDPVATKSVDSGKVERGRVTRGGREYGEVAVPLSSGQVVLFSSSLADPLSTVKLVERRLLGAALVALAIVVVLGSLAAAAHARRIRRLERAANRIAEGRFDEPVVDDGADELGQLAQAFERMRLQLAQLDTARKEFVANASHELRTPLFSLGGFLELLSDEELDEDTRAGFLATMREQVDRLTHLTTDLLDLSRVDAGRIRIEREDVELGEVARSLAEELVGLAEGSGHRVETDTDEEAWATADEERARQVGRALASNAVLHTPRGTTVRIGTRKMGSKALLTVEDDGPGIPADHLERIFDRFYRLDGSHASGSGLGLAIARELAELMGGEVVVQSQPGRTVFTLELPAAAVPEREHAHAA